MRWLYLALALTAVSFAAADGVKQVLVVHDEPLKEGEGLLIEAVYNSTGQKAVLTSFDGTASLSDNSAYEEIVVHAHSVGPLKKLLPWIFKALKPSKNAQLLLLGTSAKLSDANDVKEGLKEAGFNDVEVEDSSSKPKPSFRLSAKKP